MSHMGHGRCMGWKVFDEYGTGVASIYLDSTDVGITCQMK